MQQDFPIPNPIDIVGAHVYLQAWAPAPGANAFGVITSNAVDLRIGNL